MSELKTGSDVKKQAGSPNDELITPGPSANNIDAGGESAKVISKEEFDTLKTKLEQEQKQKAELESKLGEQGEELGDLRGFIDGLDPLLTPLQEDPELVQAIIDGKVNFDLIKPVLEGTVSAEDAKNLTAAHRSVREEMGDAYRDASEEDISKRLLAKMDEMEKNLKKNIDEKVSAVEKKTRSAEIMREHKENVEEFIKNTPDYADYAEDIVEYANKHPEITSIEVLYDAVKGVALQKAIENSKIKNTAEVAKELALNAAGGGQKSVGTIDNEDIVDSLIAPRSNPNIF